MKTAGSFELGHIRNQQGLLQADVDSLPSLGAASLLNVNITHLSSDILTEEPSYTLRFFDSANTKEAGHVLTSQAHGRF